MRFEEAVMGIGTLRRLRRIASAHVVDHRQLKDEELRDAIIRVRPQYVHQETVWNSVEQALYLDESNDRRVLSRLILRDVLLEEYGNELPSQTLEERVIEKEQEIVNQANEIDIVDLAAGNKQSKRFQDLNLYYFVLGVAWENEDTKSADEINLLRKLRTHLGITEEDHRLLEARLGKFPKPQNELHSRQEIDDARRWLHASGLLFSVRREDGGDVDVIPDELAAVVKPFFGFELRTESYRALFEHRPLRRKSNLIEILDIYGVECGRNPTVDDLIERIIRYVPPSGAIGGTSPRYGLNNQQLTAWCKELNLPTSGAFDEKIQRILQHFDQLRPLVERGEDERARWFEFYEELAWRDRETLRAQHVADKDIEIEAKFEAATRYLFQELLNHAPLKQSGVNRPDGVLMLQDRHVMWDNKSKENPVHLKDHIDQFDEYMDQAEKPVPMFLVIGPEFTEESRTEALRYHAQRFDRDVVLITAKELKDLAEEWNSLSNKLRDDPFPLGYLAVSGRFDRARLGKLF